MESIKPHGIHQKAEINIDIACKFPVVVIQAC
jgi:hypothetical protein